MTKVEQRMANGEPFRYNQLLRFQTGNSEREADKAIQRWRKKGWIYYKRENGIPVWRLTPLGVQEVLKL